LRSGPGLSSFGRRTDENVKDKKEGLLPKHGQKGGCDGEAIYMYSGATIRPGGGGQVVEEKIGRGRQERLKRKREALAAENALTKLQTLQPDDRAAISKVKVAQSIISLGQGSKSASTKPLNESNVGQEPENTTSLAYSSFIKNLGFNPGTKAETRGKGRDADVKQRVRTRNFEFEDDLRLEISSTTSGQRVSTEQSS
jgi:minichromosome maintenance protein 10